MVGTVVGSNFDALLGLKGQQTFPVLGWIQKGDFRRWFRPLVTLMSSLGYPYWIIISSTTCLPFHFKRPWNENIIFMYTLDQNNVFLKLYNSWQLNFLFWSFKKLSEQRFQPTWVIQYSSQQNLKMCSKCQRN